jgi:hypothetical protein
VRTGISNIEMPRYLSIASSPDDAVRTALLHDYICNKELLRIAGAALENPHQRDKRPRARYPRKQNGLNWLVEYFLGQPGSTQNVLITVPGGLNLCPSP